MDVYVQVVLVSPMMLNGGQAQPILNYNQKL